jgi:hypothetical protein
MKRLLLLGSALLLLLLAACAGQPSTGQVEDTSAVDAADAGESPVITVFSSPS